MNLISLICIAHSPPLCCYFKEFFGFPNTIQIPLCSSSSTPWRWKCWKTSKPRMESTRRKYSWWRCSMCCSRLDLGLNLSLPQWRAWNWLSCTFGWTRPTRRIPWEFHGRNPKCWPSDCCRGQVGFPPPLSGRWSRWWWHLIGSRGFSFVGRSFPPF